MAIKSHVEARQQRQADELAARRIVNQKAGNEVVYYDMEQRRTIYTTIRHVMATSDGRVAVSFSNGDKKIFPANFLFDSVKVS